LTLWNSSQFESERSKLSASIHQQEEELNSLRSQCTQLRQQNNFVVKLKEEKENLLESIRNKDAQLTLLNNQLTQLMKNSNEQQVQTVDVQSLRLSFEDEKKNLLLQLQQQEQVLTRTLLHPLCVIIICVFLRGHDLSYDYRFK
jgi:lipopolysaccharide export LptBFGC system permease protein LptF